MLLTSRKCDQCVSLSVYDLLKRILGALFVRCRQRLFHNECIKHFESFLRHTKVTGKPNILKINILNLEACYEKN